MITEGKETCLLLLLGLTGGSGVTASGSILHIGVILGLLRGLLSLLGLFLGLALGLELSALLGSSLLLGLLDGLALGIHLLSVALDNGTSDEANLIKLGHVNGLGGILALLI